MTRLSELAQRAGLQTLDAQVVVPNFELPLVGSDDPQKAHASEPLYCDRSFGRPADVTVLYFTLPDCENCRPGIASLERIQRQYATADQDGSSPRLCLRIVVSDWLTSAEISQEVAATKVEKIPAFVWDAQGVLSERLAVVAQPAFYLLDKDGQLLTYQNGPPDFASPGFDVFWLSLMKVLHSEDFRAGNRKLGSAFNSPRNDLSSQPVSFLSQGVLSAVWLVVLGALCYSLVRFFLRLRKNFTGSQN